jgi:methylglyoxal/glyoxal reductase
MNEVVTLLNKTNMPVVGFGTWDINPDDAATQAVLTALEAGYRHIDTAKLYNNERGVGRAVRESKVPREDVYVVTKLWNSDHGYDNALKAIDESLEKLDMEYVDLYLIHAPGPDVLDGSWQALIDIYHAGKANAIGVSNFDIEHIEQLLAAGLETPMVNQIELHPFNYQQQRKLVEYCQSKGIVVQAYSPIKRLTATGQAQIDQLATKYNKSPSQIVLRWCLQHDTVPLPRSANPEHIRENIAIFDFEINSDDIQVIDNIGS